MPKLSITVLLIALALTLTYVLLTQKTKLDHNNVAPPLVQKNKLIILTDAPYGVMEFFDKSGRIVGIDADIAQEIAKSLGVAVEMVDIDFDKLFPAINNNEADLGISATTITAERSKEVLFSIPYFNGGQIIVIKSTTSTIKTPSDLQGKKVGTQKESTGLDEVKKYTSASLITTYDSYEQPKNSKSGMISDLLTGKTEAIVIDYIAGITIIKDHPTLTIVGEPFTQEFYGIVAKKGNDKLMDRVNEVLRELKASGRFQQIVNKWI
jgi:ABC-type amino acid transport substrate-binding protein